MNRTEYLGSVFPGADEPGGCVMVARHGELLLQECSGLADLDTGKPITCDTTFRLASVSKQFTATLILMVRLSGRLRLEDRLREYLPEFSSPSTEPVTIRHLLQHTSGLLDYEDHLPSQPATPVSDEDVLQITASHDKTYFSPGTQFRYSNTGYALLACVVQRVYGSTFSDVLEQKIFQPLGMSNTVARHSTARPHVPNRAFGYRRMPDGTYVNADQNRTSSVLGDGGIYCSANDYLKWDRAYWSGQVLPPAIVQEMMTPGVLLKSGTATETDRIWFPADMNDNAVMAHAGQGSSPGDACYYAGGELADGTCQIPYGMGWRLETNDEKLAVAYHPGSSTGFMHCVRHVLEKGLTVLVLANRTVAPSKELAREIEAAMLAG